MITEKDIMPAANRYMTEIFNSCQRDNYFWSDIDFANGATWAIEQMQAENERLRADLEFTKTASAGKSRVISMLMAENERFRTAIDAALAVERTEEWDELNVIREILKKA